MAEPDDEKAPERTGGRKEVLPSLALVAELAGVSLSTASRVLRGDPYPVTQDLRNRVRSAAEQVGYIPNALARSLRSKRLTSIGLIVADMQEPYFSAIAQATTREANDLGLMSMVCNAERDPQQEVDHCAWLLSYRVGGIILGWSGTQRQNLSSPPSAHRELEAMVQRLRLANIMVIALAPKLVEMPTICVDNVAAGRFIAEHLSAAGHTEVGLITGPRVNLTQQQRAAGFTEVMHAAGARCTVIDSSFSVDGGAGGAERLIAEHPNVTAVVGGSDTIAWGALERLTESGRKVPSDVAVVGIGKTLISRLLRPPLTTVDLKLTESARAAVLALARYRDDDLKWDELAAKLPTFEPELHPGATFLPS